MWKASSISSVSAPTTRGSFLTKNLSDGLLPSGVHFGCAQFFQGFSGVIALQVSEKGSIRPEIDRIVADSAVADCLRHVRPDLVMRLDVLRLQLGPDYS